MVGPDGRYEIDAVLLRAMQYWTGREVEIWG
jgi:hypothetical protein